MKKSYRLPPAASTAPDRAAIEDALFEKLARLNAAQHAAPNQLGAALSRAYGAIGSSRVMTADWAYIAQTVIGESSQMIVVPDPMPF